MHSMVLICRKSSKLYRLITVSFVQFVPVKTAGNLTSRTSSSLHWLPLGSSHEFFLNRSLKAGTRDSGWVFPLPEKNCPEGTLTLEKFALCRKGSRSVSKVFFLTIHPSLFTWKQKKNIEISCSLCKSQMKMEIINW